MRRTTPASHGRAPRCGARSRTRSCSSGAASRSCRTARTTSRRTSGSRGARTTTRRLREPGARAGADLGRRVVRRPERQRRPERGQLHFRPAVVPRAGAARRPVVDHLRVNYVRRLLTYCSTDSPCIFSWPHRTNYGGRHVTVLPLVGGPGGRLRVARAPASGRGSSGRGSDVYVAARPAVQAIARSPVTTPHRSHRDAAKRSAAPRPKKGPTSGACAKAPPQQ